MSGATERATSSPDAGAPLLRAEAVAKRFSLRGRGLTVLRGVDLQVERGEFVAVMGASGSGKSTLLHLLGGLDQPTSGRVLVDGTDLARLSDHALTLLRRRRIGFIFQFFNLLPTLTVRENIVLPLLIAGKRPEEHARILQILIRLLHLSDILDQRPSELSGGEQQRVAVARALLEGPDLILADEPTGNLDHASGVELLDYLWSGCAHLGRTVVMVTHEAKAANYADRVLVLRDGAVMAEIPLGRDKRRQNARALVDRLAELGL